MMKISVVIPTKDEKKVFDSIRSVLDQDHEDFEIVVVDGSEGELRRDLENFCEEKGVIYIHESERSDSHVGLNGSRNIGVEKSEGDIIALLDGDCIATDNWLSDIEESLSLYDIGECNVVYSKEGKNCPLDRTVENSGKNYRFLGAGLVFKREVWEKNGFDERFFHLRNDTSFGLQALDEGFTYTYIKDAVVKHHSGRFSAIRFVKERLRFRDEPLFYNEFKENNRLHKNLDYLGPFLYPKELLFLVAFSISFLIPFSYVAVPSMMVLSGLIYIKRESKKRKLDFCLIDILLLFILTPLALIAKRYAIWRGSLQHRVFAI